MSIFLSILKIIGIILGILLAILLALVLLVVFLPICYRVEGDLQEKMEIRGRLSWLFFIRVKFLAEGKKISVWLSILGFKKVLYPAEEKAARKIKKQRRSKKQTQKHTTPEEPDTANTGFEDEVEEHDGLSVDDDPASIQTAELLSLPATDKSYPTADESPTTTDETFTDSDFSKKKSLPKFRPWHMIKTWIQKIKKFILSLKENFSNIKKEVSDETNKNAVSHIFKELKTLLHHIGPRRGKAQLSYSTGDPATTGELTGVLSIMPLFYKKGIHVVPDFTSDRFYIRGNFRVNGHFQVFHLLGIFIRVYRDKDLRKLMQKFK